jgi:RNA polymerase sigma factor (sigma-70 family)
MELHEIIDRTYEGDLQAFSELVSRYRDMAFGYAMTIVDRSETAEDAVQDAFVQVYANLDRLRDPRAFGAWLRGIVRHECYRALRSEPKTVTWDALNGPDGGSVPFHFPSNSLWSRVTDALSSLSDEEQEVIRLRYEEGLSHQEIATRLHQTIGKVNMRLHAGRSHLKRRLKLMPDEQTPRYNPGRIEEASGPLVTIQFPPHSTPPIMSRITGLGQDSLCVIRNLSAGRVEAVSARLGTIWIPGQEVLDSHDPFLEPLDMTIVAAVVDRQRSAKWGGPLATGIKAIDVFAPLTQSGTSGLFTEWGLGVLVLLPELIHNLDKGENRQTFLVFVPPVSNQAHWQELTAEVTLGSRAISIAYLPVDDPIRKDFIESFTNLDAKLVLSRHLSEQSIWPCVDPLACRSRRLDNEIGDTYHPALANEVQSLLTKYYSLQFGLDDSLRHTLTPAELQQVQRARKALRFLSQPFFVAEPYTKRAGKYVDPADAKRGFADIVAGKYDEINRDAFYMVGGVPN